MISSPYHGAHRSTRSCLSYHGAHRSTRSCLSTADATPCFGAESDTDVGPELPTLMQALKDFQDRIAKYEEVYETITDRSLHYIKLIDM